MSIPLRRPGVAALAVALAVMVAPFSSAATESEKVSAEDALQHVGEHLTVCGKVVDADYFPHLRGEPTYLNLEQPYPNPVCSVVIWGRNLSAFDEKPHQFYLGKDICVKGLVRKFRTWPQIEATSADVITVMNPGLDAARFTPGERSVIRATLGALGYCGEDTGEWTEATDRALASFQADRGLEGSADEWPQTLRALAEEASALTGEQSAEIVRMFLVHLAQREARH